MSFSKAKLKRFNDVDVVCGSPAPTVNKTNDSSNTTPGVGSAHPERKEQIEKFFKDAVRFASGSKEGKEFAIPKEGGLKEDKKLKGLRLFRTPSLPHRLRFRHHTDATANNNNNGTPLYSSKTTPSKETKSANKLKGKESLQLEISKKNELIENYICEVDVLKRHVEQLKDSESKLREEIENNRIKSQDAIEAIEAENVSNKQAKEQIQAENIILMSKCSKLQFDLKNEYEKHHDEVEDLNKISSDLRKMHQKLQKEAELQAQENSVLLQKLTSLNEEILEAHQRTANDEIAIQKNTEIIENLRNSNDNLNFEIKTLNEQIKQDAIVCTQDSKTIHNELDCLKNERNTLKNDLAVKCELIRSLQEELLDKNCEIDAHCDTIRQLCREKAKYVEREQLIDTAEEKLRFAEVQAEQKVQKLESDLENAIESEKAYWRSELDKRQKMAENEIIKIELEKQDVMVLLESTNDMLRERDEKIEKYEEQLRNGIDYYIQLSDTLQKQIVDLKQEIAKIITEKYNYQLTLSNTRSTVNILMERLKKSDSDVEQFKAELESIQLAKGALEQSYLLLQEETELLRSKCVNTETTLKSLKESSQRLQHEVSIRENLFTQLLTSEEETLAKFNKIASSFQEGIDTDASHYMQLYNDLKNKDETRDIYMQDMKKALDEFANVLQFAQIEMDNKEQILHKVQEECEQLKLENISLKSKIEDSIMKKENTTDLQKIEDLLIDSELRAECDKITSWLLNSSEKCIRNDSTHEINDLLKPSTPNQKIRLCTTPIRSDESKRNSVVSSTTPHTPRTPRTPKTPKSSHTLRTTPKKTILFPGKENKPSPQKQVLKARNM